MLPRGLAALLLLLALVAAAATGVSSAEPAAAAASPTDSSPSPSSSRAPANKPPTPPPSAGKPAKQTSAADDEAPSKKRAPARKPNPVTGPLARGASASASASTSPEKKPASENERRKPNPITGGRSRAAAGGGMAPAPAARSPAAPKPPARKPNPVTGPRQDAAAASSAAAPKVQALSAPPAANEAAAADPLAGARLGDPNTGGWRPGRATFFGAPAAFAKRYDPTRGDGSFGVLEYGACGYTDLLRDGKSVAPSFPRSQFAAVADVSPEHQGGCGRCYEVRCDASGGNDKGTPVLDNEGRPISLSTVGDAQTHNQSVRYFEGDFGRPVLESIDPSVTDSKGRPFPGNSAASSNGMRVRCFPGAPTVRVRLADSCPCRQVLKAGDPTAKSDGEVRRQQWCCGGSGVSTLKNDRPFDALTHFDLSYDAFEKLAHPVYGVQMVQFRPVDCDSGKPLPSRVPDAQSSTAPLIDRRTIYGQKGIRPGWMWFPYSKTRAELARPGAFPAGPGNKEPAAATCVELTRGGGLYFTCRDCGGKSGLQPFSAATYGPGPGGAGGPRDAVVFWIKPDGGGDAAKASPPDLKVFLRNSNAGQDKGYCRSVVRTSLLPVAEARAGGWRRYVVPLFLLGCDYPGATLADVNHIEFQNEGEAPVPFCLAGLGLA